MTTNKKAAYDGAAGHKVLLELEAKFNKKPRSTTLNIQGSQIQAISGLHLIFEKYPDPVVINAAVLKLADWFRTYNNTVKYYVYKVFKEVSEVELSKVINREETIRRILPILGSNDPIARSITLRILGCLSVITAEKLDVQYGIIQRLELATERIELEAAIEAGDRICAQSSRFPFVIYSKIVDAVKNEATSIDIKVRLIKIFRHMHQDIAMARVAKIFCIELLSDPNTDSVLVITTIRTLTLLLSKALINRKELIDKLLDYALYDQREEIQFNVLYDLVLLGKNDITVDESHMISLLRIITSGRGVMRTQLRAFKCVQSLFQSHQKLLLRIIGHRSDRKQSEFYELLMECEGILKTSVDQHKFSLIIACAKFLYSVVHVILTKYKGDDQKEFIALGTRVTDYISEVCMDLILQKITIKDLRKWRLFELLKIKARFCLLLDEWDCDSTFRDTFDILSRAEDETAIVLLPYLSSLSRKCTQLSEWFAEKAIQELKKRIDRPRIFVNLARILLRTIPYSHELTSQIHLLIQQYGGWNTHTKQFHMNGWYIYKIGMEAGLCGWYELMHIIMRDIQNKTMTEACSYWISSLSSFASAEYTLLKSDSQTHKGYTASVTDQLIETLNQLKALEVLDKPRKIQIRFIQQRLDMINNIQHTIAILDINNQEKDDMLLKRQIRLMNGCAVKFRKLAFRYDHIAQSQMGVDNELLNIFECYKISALVCEHAARTFVGSKDLFFCIDPSLIPVLDEIRTEDKMEEDVEQSQLGRLMNLNKRFLKSIVKWEDSVEDDHSSRNDEMISMLEDILYKPLIIPRSFFHRQKKSPKKRIMNEVNTMNDNLIHIMQPGMDIIEYMDDSADLMQPYYE